jgi:siroheme synthase
VIVPRRRSSEPRVYFVGAGAGAADLLTLRAIRLLARAEFVLNDALVEPTVLDIWGRARRALPSASTLSVPLLHNGWDLV